MKFFHSALLLSAIPLLASAFPFQGNKGQHKGVVRMAFDIGGSREYMYINAYSTAQCISIASGGILTEIETPSDIACYLRANGCGGDSDKSAAMFGHINLNGSGGIAEMAKYARSMECGPKESTHGNKGIHMEIMLDGVADTIDMEVTTKGCISLPGQLHIDSMNIGSDVSCYLASDCQSKDSVGAVFEAGSVDVKSIRHVIQKAGALACGPAN